MLQDMMSGRSSQSLYMTIWRVAPPPGCHMLLGPERVLPHAFLALNFCRQCCSLAGEERLGLCLHA